MVAGVVEWRPDWGSQETCSICLEANQPEILAHPTREGARQGLPTHHIHRACLILYQNHNPGTLLCPSCRAPTFLADPALIVPVPAENVPPLEGRVTRILRWGNHVGDNFAHYLGIAALYNAIGYSACLSGMPWLPRPFLAFSTFSHCLPFFVFMTGAMTAWMSLVGDGLLFMSRKTIEWIHPHNSTAKKVLLIASYLFTAIAFCATFYFLYSSIVQSAILAPLTGDALQAAEKILAHGVGDPHIQAEILKWSAPVAEKAYIAFYQGFGTVLGSATAGAAIFIRKTSNPGSPMDGWDTF